MSRTKIGRCLFIATLALAQAAAGAMTLRPGDVYTSNYFSNTINHYDVSGTLIDSLTLPSSIGSEVKGLTFGDNGLLYAVVVNGAAFNVVAIDGSGTVHESYSGAGYIAGNLSYGKIAFGSNGNFYVAGSDNLVAFSRGDSQGRIIRTDNQMFDVEVLPSGNLLALSAYGLTELTPTGALVRSIVPVGGISLVDARGVEFNPVTNDIFVTMLGYSNQFFSLMRLDAATGQLERNESFWYGDDLFLLDDGRLLVGSRTQAPGLFSQDLTLLGALGTQQQMFVTQMPVPEPGAWLLLLAGGLVVGLRRRQAAV